jgi:hypothetical protein
MKKSDAIAAFGSSRQLAVSLGISAQSVHQWPEIIAARDAYPKKTCLWTGGGFLLPPMKPVEVRPGYSDQHHKLGGKSIKTKNIRSATPRGFARAVFEMYGADK